MRSWLKMHNKINVSDQNIQLKEAERELKEALHETELANRAKSFFLSGMSHEIRTPLNAILGIAEIELKKGTLPRDTARALEKIYESGDLLLNIINDILDFSKIEAEKMEIRPVAYSLPKLVEETVRINLARYDNKEIDFALIVDEDTPLNMHGDKLRIKQVLNNLLSNALKYTDKGEVKLGVSSRPLENDEVCLMLTVSDTGCGMTEEQVSMLFREYMRFNLGTNKTVPGTGLGMSITKRLLDLMRGEITVYSEIGIGTTFAVRLPQKRVDDSVCGYEVARQLRNLNYRRAVISEERSSGHGLMPDGKVLIVDDMKTNIYVTKALLTPYGLNIDIATSGFEAIEKVKNGEEYDIIFMDYTMPGMDGMEATKILRDMGYKNAISALTANALTGQAEVFLENGFDAFLSKPIDTHELTNVLYKFIRGKKVADVVSA